VSPLNRRQLACFIIQQYKRHMAMVPESIHQKLRFARKRLGDLETLIANNQLAADPDARHQLTQEFLFHLIGAREYLVQLVNERRSLQLSPENVDIYWTAPH
jgi:hypothetical protein